MEKQKITFEELQSDYPQLSIAHITTGMNGYPEGLGDRVAYGFKSFADAEKLAHIIGGEIVHIHRKDGWHFWDITGNAYEPYTAQNYVERSGDNSYQVNMDAKNFLLEKKERINEFIKYEWDGDIESFRNELNDIENHYNMIDECGKDECVIVVGGCREIVPIEMMSFVEDTHHYAVGVKL